MDIDEKYMLEALKEARAAFNEDEIPVGAVVVCKGRIIGKGHNMTETLHDPTAHAEMIAITAATEALGGKYLTDCTLYVTVEPCPMCAGAMVNARITRLVYGAKDPKAGAAGSVLNIVDHSMLNHRLLVQEGLLAEECAGLLKDFFGKKRKKEQKTVR